MAQPVTPVPEAAYTQKLNTLRSLNSRTLDRAAAKDLRLDEMYMATNSYIMQSVSVLMNIPLRNLRFENNTVLACNARMLCWYILKERTGLSFEKISKIYNVNVSMVHRKYKQMDMYYTKKFYPELTMIVDLVNDALKDKLLLYTYEKEQSKQSNPATATESVQQKAG